MDAITDSEIAAAWRTLGSALARPSGEAVLVSVAEAARLLGVGKTRVYTMLRDGELAGVTVGGTRKIPRHSIDDLVARLLGAA